jgi:transketolase
MGKRGQQLSSQWNALFTKYSAQYPDLAAQYERMKRHEPADGWDKELPTFAPDAKGIATRDSSAKVLNAIAKSHPWLMGGSADLYPSTKTRLTFDGAGDFEANNYNARNFHFGIREHAMGAIVNGMTLSKIRAYGSTFLIFSDYMKMPIRLSSIMEIPALWIFTHDSIGVGEDGPTHQPIEQLLTLRAVPGLMTLRPADANEVVEAWKIIMKLKKEPVALILTRQALPTLDRTNDRAKYAPAAGVARGAYILADAEGGKPQVILMATGSEVYLCIDAYEKLKAEGIRARVVSMPSWDLFEHQDKSYRDEVLPPNVTARVAVEMASTFGWTQYAGTKGRIIGMHTFGASAPLKDLQKKFGFTADAVVQAAREQLGK